MEKLKSEVFNLRQCAFLSITTYYQQIRTFGGVVVYEAAAKDGFFRDTTNAHLVNVGAVFVPYFDGKHTLVTRNDDDYDAICNLKPLEVKPATKEEMEELAKILK